MCVCVCLSNNAGLKAFFPTPQLPAEDKAANALALGTSPIVRSLIDPEGGMRDIRALDNISFQEWFTSHGGSMQSIKKMWDPIGELYEAVLVTRLQQGSQPRLVSCT